MHFFVAICHENIPRVTCFFSVRVKIIQLIYYNLDNFSYYNTLVPAKTVQTIQPVRHLFIGRLLSGSDHMAKLYIFRLLFIFKCKVIVIGPSFPEVIFRPVTPIFFGLKTEP